MVNLQLCIVSIKFLDAIIGGVFFFFNAQLT